jgi:type IV secretion system protein TrbE
MIWSRHQQKRGPGFSELIDYHTSVAPGVHLLTSGIFLSAWKLRGPDTESMPIEHSADLYAKIAASFRLGAGWSVQSDQFQAESFAYSTAQEWADPLSYLIDQERQALFQSRGETARFQSDFYLSVAYQPPRQPGQKGIEWMFGDGDHEGQAARDLRVFCRKVDEIDRVLRAELLRAPGAFVERLGIHQEGQRKYDDLLRYIRRCIKGEDFNFALPSCPYFHHQLFGVEFTGGKYPIIEDQHLRVLAITKFPDNPDKSSQGSYPGILGALEALPFRFRFVQQGQCIPEMEAKKVHEKDEARWSVVKKGTFSREGGRVNSNAQRLEDESRRAAEDAEYGKEYYVRYSAKILLMDENPAVFPDQMEMVKNLVNSIGFDVSVETRNSVRAFLSSLPGHAHKERRKFLATVDNLSQMAQLSAPYTGPEWNPSKFLPPQTPPLFWACTLGRVPCRFHAHVTADGIGHIAIAGPSGTGKTTLVGLMAAQNYRLHSKAQAFVFDKDYTQYTLIKAMGGDYYTLAPGELSFCPLQDLSTPYKRAWAGDYIEMLCVLNGHEPDARERNAITSTVETIQVCEDHSLTQFQALVGPLAPAIAEVLQIYTMGEAGGILDGTRDNLSFGRIAAFEMGAIYKLNPKIASAVLFYIFHRVEERFDPFIPTLISIDEFRAALEQPLAAKHFGIFLEQGRKQGAYCVIAIQEIAKILNSPLAHTIARECLTKIFLPNPAAKGAERPVYELFEATEQDLQYIAAGTRCRDYYVVNPQSRRYITLELGPLAVAFLTNSTKDDCAEVNRLERLYQEYWPAHWMRQFGLSDRAKVYEELIAQTTSRRRYAVA